MSKGRLISHEDFIKGIIKNDKIEIVGEYTGARNNISIKCIECNNTWTIKAECLKRYLVKCQTCNRYNKKKTTDDFKEEVLDLVGNEYIVISEYINSKHKIRLQHKKCNGIYEVSPSNFIKGKRCPYCSGRNTLVGQNDMWTTNPELAKLLRNPEDGYRYKQWSNIKVNWKCPDCGEIIKGKSISQINGYKLSCPRCSDGISYPEKFMHYFLQQLNINFERQKTFEWSKCIEHENERLCGDKRYDFYIPSLNTIIETHGEQHNMRPLKFNDCRTLEEEMENDRIKTTIAKENGVHSYIVINCMNSDLNYIRKNIVNSELNNLYDLKIIDWKLIHEKSIKPMVKVVAELWNQGYRETLEISKIINLSKTTVNRYVNQARVIGWCLKDAI